MVTPSCRCCSGPLSLVWAGRHCTMPWGDGRTTCNSSPDCLCLWVSDTPSPAAVGAVVTFSSKNLAGEAGNLVVGMAAGVFSSLAAWLVWVKDMGDTAPLELGCVCGGTPSQAAGSTPWVCKIRLREKQPLQKKKKKRGGAIFKINAMSIQQSRIPAREVFFL